MIRDSNTPGKRTFQKRYKAQWLSVKEADTQNRGTISNKHFLLWRNSLLTKCCFTPFTLTVTTPQDIKTNSNHVASCTLSVSITFW